MYSHVLCYAQHHAWYFSPLAQGSGFFRKRRRIEATPEGAVSAVPSGLLCDVMYWDYWGCSLLQFDEMMILSVVN